ncbi:hypothetical protein L7F22_027721 [Adiantum nelumboides]|nr:hypothetical protein [Adiantum nelumboides]
MDDYFLAVGTSPKNQAMLGMFQLTGDAKLWWKQHCRDNPANIPSWERMKQAVKERYLPPAHQAIKMNEFFALRKLALTLEEYYTKFVSLRRTFRLNMMSLRKSFYLDREEAWERKKEQYLLEEEEEEDCDEDEEYGADEGFYDALSEHASEDSSSSDSDDVSEHWDNDRDIGKHIVELGNLDDEDLHIQDKALT